MPSEHPLSRRRTLLGAALASGMLALPTHRLCAQSAWRPTRPIRLVIPYGPGGSSDVIGRLIAAEMAHDLGQPIVVDNKGGASGQIAMMDVARSSPDGSTIVLGHVGTLAVNPAMFDKLPYAGGDFAPIGLLAKVPMVFAVGSKVPADSLGTFIKLAKDAPGKLTYGSAGNGSAGHLAFEMLKLATGINVLHIPYKGTGAQLNDLLAGVTDAAAAGPPGLIPHAASGRIRIIASGSSSRLTSLPDAPTVAELGYPGFDSSQWFGLLAPAGTPADIIGRIGEAAGKALEVPAVRARLTADGSQAAWLSADPFAAFIRSEQQRWGDVVRRARLKAD